MLEILLRDTRYALRVLRRSPLFTLTAVLILALAIGVNAAVFSIVNGVLLEPLPYPNPERLALVSRDVRSGGLQASDEAVDGRTWELVRDRATSVERAVFSTWATGVNLTAPRSEGATEARHVQHVPHVQHVQHVQQQRVGAGFFRVLGVLPMVGREFTLDEDRPGGPAATILSAALWRSVFGADAGVVGRSIGLRGEAYTVVGVMPDRFQTGVPADLWTPLQPANIGEGGGENYHVLVRVRDDGAWGQAEGEVASAGAERLRERPPTDGARVAFSLVPLQQGMTDTVRRPLLILWAAVGVVLLVASVNLAGLLLARASGRTREIATRMALGSGRTAVVRQVLIESLVLGVIGGAAGILVGHLALDGLRRLAEGAYDIWQPVLLDARSSAAALALSFTAAILCGCAPALHASRVSVQAGLVAGGARSIAGTSSRWPRRVLVVAQVALGVVLLVAAGLLLRTFLHLRSLDPGFDARDVVTASVSLEDVRYRTGDRVARLFEESLQRVRQAPGIESAAISLGVPYERLLNLGFRHLDGQEAAAARGRMTNATYVTSDFFTVMRIPIRRGRALDEKDRAGSAAVVVVSDAFARAYFGESDPIGRRIGLAGAARQVVGIVGDVQVKPGWGDNGPLSAMPLAYLPVEQMSDGFVRLVHGWFSPTFIVRSSLPAADTTTALRRAVDAVDPLLPFAQVRVMSDVQSESLAPQRFLMVLLLALAAVAVLLTAVGIHGLIASSVTERTREMGIRMALGATLAQALRALAAPGILLAAVGTAIGLAAALAAGRFIQSFVWGVSPTDPLTFAGVALLLLAVATAASMLPALRILRLDPASTLRAE